MQYWNDVYSQLDLHDIGRDINNNQMIEENDDTQRRDGKHGKGYNKGKDTAEGNNPAPLIKYPNQIKMKLKWT